MSRGTCRGRLAAVTAALSCALCALPVAADPAESEKERPADLLRTGAAAASARRWGDCIDALTAAATLEDSAKTWGDLGLCEEQAGRSAAAYMHLRRAMEGAPAQPDREPWTRYLAARARVIERVALVVVTTFPPNARVVLDGRPLGAADGRAFAVEPGTHTITARLDGYSESIESRTVRAGDTPRIHLHLEPVPLAATPAPANTRATDLPASPPDPGMLSPARPPVPARPPLSRLFLPGPSPRGVLVGSFYVAAAATLASGGAWLGLEVDRAALRGQVDRTACSPFAPSRPATCDALQDRVRQRDAAADATLGTGIATALLGTAAGVAIGLTHGDDTPTIAPSVSANGAGIVIGGAW